MTRTKISLLELLASLWALPALCGKINLPGYETIHLKAGQVPQEVSFINPPENLCYFRLTLITEDGKELWRSELIEPGGEVREILLSEPLEAGTYGAILKYECFALEDKSPLNGLNMKLKIVSEVSRHDEKTD